MDVACHIRKVAWHARLCLAVLAVLAVFLGDRVGVNDLMRLAVLGGWIYLIFRVAHFVCFTLSVPYLRTASWFISTFGIANDHYR